jgi:hypothetical protein
VKKLIWIITICSLLFITNCRNSKYNSVNCKTINIEEQISIEIPYFMDFVEIGATSDKANNKFYGFGNIQQIRMEYHIGEGMVDLSTIEPFIYGKLKLEKKQVLINGKRAALYLPTIENLKLLYNQWIDHFVKTKSYENKSFIVVHIPAIKESNPQITLCFEGYDKNDFDLAMRIIRSIKVINNTSK